MLKPLSNAQTPLKCSNPSQLLKSFSNAQIPPPPLRLGTSGGVSTSRAVPARQVTHYGEAIKSLINEQCGDGIMSAIDFYCDVGTVKGESRGGARWCKHVRKVVWMGGDITEIYGGC
eukprot:4384671-Pleurochrysis_carterae.AAC.1